MNSFLIFSTGIQMIYLWWSSMSLKVEGLFAITLIFSFLQRFSQIHVGNLAVLLKNMNPTTCQSN